MSVRGFWPPFRGPGGGSPGPGPDPVFPSRQPLDANMRFIDSGHSLTDARITPGGAAWPGPMRRLAMANGLATAESNLIKSTIPGSAIDYRWGHRVAANPSANEADARWDIDQFNTLIITEAGPPPHPDTLAGMPTTLDYLCRFAANQIEGGAGQDLILWSIWPALEGAGSPNPPPGWGGVGFRDGLDLYARSFKHMADYTQWKMRQVYPALPDYRVWIMPGSQWMARMHDDVQAGFVPGVTDISDLFSDDDPPGQTIHTTQIAGYGMAMLGLSVLYHHEWSLSDTFPVEDGVTPELIEYFIGLANELSRSYGPAGRGGAQGWALEFDGDTDADPLPDWSFDPGPDPEPGDLPDLLIEWTADGYTGPPLTGTPPAVQDGALVFDGSALSCAADLTGFYAIWAMRMEGGDRLAFPLAALNNPGAGWPAPSVTVNVLGTPGSASLGIQGRNPGWDDPQGAVGVGTRDWTEYQLVEVWAFPGNSGAALNGVDMQTSDDGDIPSTTHLDFFRPWEGPGASATDLYIAPSLRVMDTMPTETERAALRAAASTT